MAKLRDLTGNRVGRLLVVGPRNVQGKISYWPCRCDCGTEKLVKGTHLTGGLTQSCGCLRREKSRARIDALHRANTKTGLSKSRIYSVWSGMKSRCNNPKNPKFKDYGGRGIAVCERWADFANFLADMGVPRPGMTLDRANNDKGYSPDNCRWATRQTQSRNQRVTRKIRVGEQEFIVADLADLSGLKTDTIIERAKHGLSIGDLVSPKHRVYRDGLALGGLANGARQRAKTHCKHGHPFDEANTRVSAEGYRICRTCKRLRMRVVYAARRAARPCSI